MPKKMETQTTPEVVEDYGGRRYLIKRPIGRGSFSTVFRSTCLDNDDSTFALKQINLDKYTTVPTFQKEANLMRLLYGHENILSVYDHWIAKGRKTAYIAMEYMEGGTLRQLIRARRRLDERTAKSYLRQLVSALIHCHQNRVYHRDVKPTNILLDKEHRELKLADFGHSVKCNDGWLTSAMRNTKYAAPEAIAPQGLNGYEGGAAEVWSCGVILLVMLAGATLFPDDKDDMSVSVHLDRTTALEFEFPRDVSVEARHLLHRMLEVVPGRRISANDVLGHPWLTGTSVSGFRVICFSSLAEVCWAFREICGRNEWNVEVNRTMKRLRIVPATEKVAFCVDVSEVAEGSVVVEVLEMGVKVFSVAVLLHLLRSQLKSIQVVWESEQSGASCSYER